MSLFGSLTVLRPPTDENRDWTFSLGDAMFEVHDGMCELKSAITDFDKMSNTLEALSDLIDSITSHGYLDNSLYQMLNENDTLTEALGIMLPRELVNRQMEVAAGSCILNKFIMDGEQPAAAPAPEANKSAEPAVPDTKTDATTASSGDSSTPAEKKDDEKKDDDKSSNDNSDDDSEKKGFFTKAWELIKKFFIGIKNAIVRVWNAITGKKNEDMVTAAEDTKAKAEEVKAAEPDASKVEASLAANVNQPASSATTPATPNTNATANPAITSQTKNAYGLGFCTVEDLYKILDGLDKLTSTIDKLPADGRTFFANYLAKKDSLIVATGVAAALPALGITVDDKTINDDRTIEIGKSNLVEQSWKGKSNKDLAKSWGSTTDYGNYLSRISKFAEQEKKIQSKIDYITKGMDFLERPDVMAKFINDNLDMIKTAAGTKPGIFGKSFNKFLNILTLGHKGNLKSTDKDKAYVECAIGCCRTYAKFLKAILSVVTDIDAAVSGTVHAMHSRWLGVYKQLVDKASTERAGKKLERDRQAVRTGNASIDKNKADNTNITVNS